MKAETSFSLKDELFNRETVGYLSKQLASASPEFDASRFRKDVLVALPDLELKERIAHISEVMAKHLPEDYSAALKVVVAALPDPLDPSKTDDDFGDFIIAPLGHFVAQYGASKRHLKKSLKALREITQRFSAEDPIRTFLNEYSDETLNYLVECASHDNYHVRRWASEGTRPKLPWSQKLLIDHTDPLPILDKLYADPTRYVTRSVANHLNDIAKIDPDLVITTLKRWKKSGKQDPTEMKFIIEHATRTLIKQGDQDALSLMGYGTKPNVVIDNLQTTTPTVPVGSPFEFSFELTANKSQNLMIDYVMVFAGPEGAEGGRKVFKLKRIETEPGQLVSIKKRHPMKLMTTRRLYEGQHTITLQLNGRPFDSLSFDLVAADE